MTVDLSVQNYVKSREMHQDECWEVWVWLEANAGNEGDDWEYGWGSPDMPPRRTKRTYVEAAFKDKQVAALFKLVWG